MNKDNCNKVKIKSQGKKGLPFSRKNFKKKPLPRDRLVASSISRKRKKNPIGSQAEK